MGRLVEQLAPEYDCRVTVRLTAENNIAGAGITRDTLSDVDVAIEFSTPEPAASN